MGPCRNTDPRRRNCLAALHVLSAASATPSAGARLEDRVLDAFSGEGLVYVATRINVYDVPAPLNDRLGSSLTLDERQPVGRQTGKARSAAGARISDTLGELRGVEENLVLLCASPGHGKTVAGVAALVGMRDGGAAREGVGGGGSLSVANSYEEVLQLAGRLERRQVSALAALLHQARRLERRLWRARAHLLERLRDALRSHVCTARPKYVFCRCRAQFRTALVSAVTRTAPPRAV